METISSSSSPSIPHEPSNYDELFMQQSLHFSDSLKDLKNLRMQLYSAAEYFEVSYSNDDQKQTVVDTLKDYTVKAFVNTVDHLGSVSYKVNDLLDEKVDEVSGTELRVTCIEQRLKTCQENIDQEGLSQQSLVIVTPKYHKRYILAGGEKMQGSQHTVLKYQGRGFDNDDAWSQRKNDCDHIVKTVQATIRDTPPVRKGRSPSPSSRPGMFSFTEKQKVSEKRTVSPLHSRFPLLRSGSFSSRPTTPSSTRPTTPNLSRPATPNSSYNHRRYPSELRKSASVCLHGERDNSKDVEQQPSKSKRLLRALLSRRKSKKDDTLYTFLDEY